MSSICFIFYYIIVKSCRIKKSVITILQVLQVKLQLKCNFWKVHWIFQ